MRQFSRIAGTAIILSMMVLCMQGGAVSLNLELDTTEYINDLVFYSDGTYECGDITGYLSVTNPSSNDTVSDINISFSDGITPSEKFINELRPNSTTIIPYQLSGSGVLALPEVNESVTPSELISGAEQEITYTVRISNPGSETIEIISFEKPFSDELNSIGYTASAGTLEWDGDRSLWKDFIIQPYSSETLDLNFRTTPGENITFAPSTLSFASQGIVASRSLSLSAVTTTRFTVEKEKVSEGKWQVGVIVEDASDFDYSLYNVEVYVSDTALTDPTLIREYDLDVTLHPDDTWSDSFSYDYLGTPVFFARVYYTIPYTISGYSMPLNPAGSNGFVINSVVYDDEVKTGGGGDEVGEPVIVKIPSDLSPYYSNGRRGSPTIVTNNGEGGDGDGGGGFDMKTLLASGKAYIIAGASMVGLYGLLLLYPFILAYHPKNQLVVGSNHLISVVGPGGFGSIVSKVDKVIMSKDTFKRLQATGLIADMEKMVDDKDIRIVDMDYKAVNNLMDEYDLLVEDADVLAASLTSKVKKVFITSPEVEAAVKDMGLKPVYLSDILGEQEE